MILAANLLSNIGNLALFIGAFLVLLGTWLTIWAGGQKERYADERITSNERLTADANADAAKAIKETETIRGENLRLATALEKEKVARAKIEAGLASRKVGGTTRNAFISSLKNLTFKPMVQVQRITGDTEARLFGNELVRALQEAGFQVNDSTVGIAFGFPDGLTVQSPIAEFINAFRSSGLATSAAISAAGSPTSVLIGLKPPSF